MHKSSRQMVVAGVGATRFTEHWDRDQYDLLTEASYEAVEDAGLTLDDVQAAWIGNYYPFTGLGGATVTDALRIYGKPVSRVENYCASGMDAFRNACFAVAAGEYDIVLVCGVEKLTDQGASGLPSMGRSDPVLERPSHPGMFALVATKAFAEWGWSEKDLAEVAVKNHGNGSLHPKAHLRNAISLDEALAAPEIASPLKRSDCCTVSDGAAAVVVTSREVASHLAHKDNMVVVGANEISTHSYQPHFQPGFSFLGFEATRDAASRAYKRMQIDDPVAEVDLCECHDCFTITELINMQDLGLCEPGEAVSLVRSGDTQVDGRIPINPSGGLKCFGHPIGATGCRMIYEVARQLQGRALGRQVPNASLGLAHNLGGPGATASVTILARADR